MSRKNRIAPWRIFNAVDMSSSQTSDISCIEGVDNLSLSVSWAGSSADGVLTVQVANYDPNQTGFTPVWQTLDFGSSIATSGSSGTHSISIQNMGFYFLRVVYTRTGGTGSLTVALSGKGLG